jgi:hypothetical protein
MFNDQTPSDSSSLLGTSLTHEGRGNRQKLIVQNVPDCPHHVVQRGVRRIDFFFSADTDKNTWICKKGGWQKGKKRK